LDLDDRTWPALKGADKVRFLRHGNEAGSGLSGASIGGYEVPKLCFPEITMFEDERRPISRTAFSQLNYEIAMGSGDDTVTIKDKILAGRRIARFQFQRAADWVGADAQCSGAKPDDVTFLW
jgi:hypothetical protein